MSDYIPLDPDEGPTVWATRTDAHTVEIVGGTDPDDPMYFYQLSDAEIERLYTAITSGDV